jgi:hypothetical protein
LPDREQATSEVRVKKQRSVGMWRVTGAAEGEATTCALPTATQVADRWNLMANASRAFLDAVRRS